MNKQLVIGAVAAAVGAVVGVALAEWITTDYWVRLIIIGLGAMIGTVIGRQLASR